MVAFCGLIAASKVPAEGFKLRVIGLLHTMADGLKMIWKEDFIPKRGDRILHSLAPMIAMFPPLVVFAVIPFGDVLCFATKEDGGIVWTQVLPVVSRYGVCAEGGIPMQISNLDVGILFIFAISGTGILGAAIGGWASDNKYSLLGGLRAAGQMVSYEITLGLTLIGLFMIYSTLRLDDMVRWQGENAWGIFIQPLAFFLFFAAATAETKRIPFDLPEGESEILGYFTEYSSMKFGMFFFAEYIEVVTSSAIMVTLFLGGWNLPFLHRDGFTLAIGDAVMLKYAMTHGSVVALQVVTFFLKVLAFAWLQVVVRWTLPRFRYDQLMKMCWRILLPLSIANIMVTAVLVLIVSKGSVAAQSGLAVAGEVTQLFTGAAMLFAFVAFVRFMLKPVHKKRVVLTSSTKMVAEHGVTKREPMQA
ncbi:MAG: NADH-quinone oxidoreductase subunit H [Sorangium cellulosum]|nr:MAG: NADH-quinone oxidoreductase subunit H [Sorangium cellulosum]